MNHHAGNSSPSMGNDPLPTKATNQSSTHSPSRKMKSISPKRRHKSPSSPNEVLDKRVLSVGAMMCKLHNDMQGSDGPVNPIGTVELSLACPDLFASTSLGEDKPAEVPLEMAMSRDIRPMSTTSHPQSSTEEDKDMSKHIEKTFKPGFVWVNSNGAGDVPEWAARSTSGENSSSVGEDPSAPKLQTCFKKTSVLAIFGMDVNRAPLLDHKDETTSVRPSIMRHFQRQTSDEIKALPRAERISMKGRPSSFFFPDEHGTPGQLQRWSQRMSQHISALSFANGNNSDAIPVACKKSRVTFFGEDIQDELPSDLLRWGRHIAALNDENFRPNPSRASPMSFFTDVKVCHTSNRKSRVSFFGIEEDEEEISSGLKRWEKRISSLSNNATSRISSRKSRVSFLCGRDEIQDGLPSDLRRWEKRISALSSGKKGGPCASRTSTIDAPVYVVAKATPIQASTFSTDQPPCIWDQLNAVVEDILSFLF